jgi:excisionase family DNA binding protein
MSARPRRTAVAIDPNTLMTPTEVGAILGCSKWTVHRYCSTGKLGARRVGNRWKISGAHVVTFLTGTDNQPAASAS